MNSKSGEEQKKGHHVRRSPNFDSNSDTEQKKGQNDNGLILGRVLGLDTSLVAGSILAIWCPENTVPRKCYSDGKTLETMSDLNRPAIKPYSSSTNSSALTITLTG